VLAAVVSLPTAAAVEKEVSLYTKQPLGDLAVAGRLSVDLHAEFMASREYGTETVLNWYNCGYSGGGGEGGTVTKVGGTFGDFGFQVPYAEREKKYPHAVTVGTVRAVRFDGGDFMKGNFPVEKSILDGGQMAIEVWFRCEKPEKGDVVLGWQSADGAESSAPLSLSADFTGSEKWRHLVVNCTPEKEEWSLDGVKVKSGKREMLVKDGHVMVLGGESAGKPSFKGDLVAVRLHDAAMMDEEIAHNVKGGPMLGTDLKDWYALEADTWWTKDSEHFRHAVDLKEMAKWDAKALDAFNKRVPGMFDLAELAYHTYSERLALRTSVVSVLPEERGDGIKYKTPIAPTSGGSWMGWNGHFGYSMQGPGYINPHELVHGWCAMTGNLWGNYWETHANFPQTYCGIYQQLPVVGIESSFFPASGRTFYGDRGMFEHLAQTPEYGPMFISKLWYDGPTETEKGPFPWLIFNRINPYLDRTLADEAARLAMRNVTWDYTTFKERKPGETGNTPYGNDGVVSDENIYRKAAGIGTRGWAWSRAILEKIPYEPEWWRVPKEQTPQQLGWNVCPLKFKPGKVSATLAGYVDDTRGSDWRAGFVGVDADGNPSYGEVFGPGKVMTFDVKDDIKQLYLAVTAVPKRIMAIDMTGDYKSLAQQQFPYKVKLAGCAPLDVLAPEKPTFEGAPHPNGGGFVAKTAQADATAYVGPDAQVLGTSKVLGNARIEDYAVINNSTVKDEAVVSGHALVQNNATVAEHARVRDSAIVDASIVKGHARVLEHGRVATRQGTTKGNVTIKGISSVYGGNQSGTSMLDGSYAKGNEITQGKWFTWSWAVGKNPGEIDEDFGGLYADYEFSLGRVEPYPAWMAFDSFGVTWGYLANGAKVEPVNDWPTQKKKPSTKTPPNPTAVLPALDAINLGDNYAQQLSGYLLPPTTGDYTFWIAADDEGEVWLGGAGAATVEKKICHTGCVGPKEFGQNATQKSAPIRLEQGKAYPIKILHAESRFGDHVAVAWTKPGSTEPEIIGKDSLSVTANGKQPGVSQRGWRGVTRILDLIKQTDVDFDIGDNGAVSLNGENQFVELQKDVADFSACTYAVEFKSDGNGAGAKIFEFANPNGDALWLSPSEEGKLVFAIRKGKTVESIAAPAAKKGVWTRVQVMLDGSSGALYVNDKKVGNNPDMTLRPESVRATECYLGRGLEGGYFGGSISRFTVHSIPLIHSHPPSPDPAAFELAPAFINSSDLVMSAVKGNALSGGVEYFFKEDGGSWDSGWTKESRILVEKQDSAKPASYRVRMRDNLGNETAFSSPVVAAGIGRDAKAYTVTPTGPMAIEAEHSVRTVPSADGYQWELKTDVPGFTGKGYMQALPDRRSRNPGKIDGARMDYLVNFEKPGRCFVWLRAFAPYLREGDAVHLGLDLKLEPWGEDRAIAVDHFMWGGRREFNVTAPGLHTFSIWMLEDGAIIDRILFTADEKYVPGDDTKSPAND